jgi:hypothetical protein
VSHFADEVILQPLMPMLSNGVIHTSAADGCVRIVVRYGPQWAAAKLTPAEATAVADHLKRAVEALEAGSVVDR